MQDPNTTDSTDVHLTLTDHLVELRKRLINAVLGILVGFVAAWGFSEKVFDIVRRPIAPYLKNGLVFTGVSEKFLAHVKVSFIAGVILSCPFWLHQVWKFVAPALYKNERKYIVSFMVLGSTLFVLGVSFAYFLVLPAAFKYLLLFGGDTDAPMITISEYLSFFNMTVFILGLAFEMPLILTLLGMLGVIDHAFLAKNRRYAVVILAILSAVFSPPDAMSMVLVMVPLFLLYELSILIMRFTAKQKTS